MHLLILLALASGATSISTDEYRKLPECQLSADGMHLRQQPCRTAPARKNMPRRPVPQIVTPTPRIAPAPDPALTWAPILGKHDPVPTVISQLPRAGQVTSPMPGPSAPTPVFCDAGGCRDPGSGIYYHGPPGQVISPSGRVCSSSAGWMTCY